MFGAVIAFKKYSIAKGILGSDWIGFGNFEFFLSSGHASRITFNTLYLNILFITFSVAFQVLIAIFLNEITSKWYRKLTQSMIFLPYFLSWVVVSVMSIGIFATDKGALNSFLTQAGLPAVNWYMEPSLWPTLLTIFYVWKWTGYGSVIYLATIAGFDETLYEAAVLDGAGKVKQILYITLPLLFPTILVLVLLAIGRIFYGDFGMIYGIIGDNGMLFKTTDVIDTYVFRALRQQGNFGMAAAVGFYQSIMGFALVLISNLVVRKLNPDGALF